MGHSIVRLETTMGIQKHFKEDNIIHFVQYTFIHLLYVLIITMLLLFAVHSRFGLPSLNISSGLKKIEADLARCSENRLPTKCFQVIAQWKPRCLIHHKIYHILEIKLFLQILITYICFFLKRTDVSGPVPGRMVTADCQHLDPQKFLIMF